MAANNSRVRRLLVELFYERGPLNIEQVLDWFNENERSVPSVNSLSSILCKNIQIIPVGVERLDAERGRKNYTRYDVDRNLIRSKADIELTISKNMMSPSEARRSSKCPNCGRQRILPEGEEHCLHCLRSE